MIPLRKLSICAILCLESLWCWAQSNLNSPHALAVHLEKAQEFLRQKRPDLAIPELQAAVAIDAGNVDAQGNLGVLLYFRGDFAQAIPHLRVAIDKQPSLAKIQGILGIAEMRTSDPEQARKDLEAAFLAVGDNKFKVEIGLDLVTLYTQSEDLERAADTLAQLKKLAPDNPEVLYAAYRTHSELSLESMLALSLVAPNSAQMHQLLAQEQIKEGNTNAAIAEYRKAIQLDPHLPGVHFELAELLHTSQDAAVKRQAEQEYRTALAENPQDEKALCRLGDIAAQRGDSQQEYANYSKAVALQPADAAAKLGLAKALLEMNQDGKALALLEASEQLEPTNDIVHYRLATLYRKMGRTDDARREAEQYKKFKDMKEQLRTLYKGLLIQPEEIRRDETDEPNAK